MAPGDLTDLAADALLGLWPVGDEATRAERNALTGDRDLRLDGVTWRRGVKGRALDFDGTAAAWPEDVELDLEDDDATIAAWIQTTSDGTVFADARPDGDWVPDGVTLFLRDGQLTFDVGWVGAPGGPRIDDGAAPRGRHVALEDGEVRLFVDGVRVARELPRGQSRRRFRPLRMDERGFRRRVRYMENSLIADAVDDDRVVDLAVAGAGMIVGTVVSGAEGAERPAPSTPPGGGGFKFAVTAAVTAWRDRARHARGCRPFASTASLARGQPHDSMRFGARPRPEPDEEGLTSAVIATVRRCVARGRPRRGPRRAHLAAHRRTESALRRPLRGGVDRPRPRSDPRSW